MPPLTQTWSENRSNINNQMNPMIKIVFLNVRVLNSSGNEEFE